MTAKSCQEYRLRIYGKLKCFSMEHKEHVFLIKKAITKPAGVWAEFGSGDGAFTLALRDLAGEDVEIYSIDRDRERLRKQEIEFNFRFPNTNIHYLNSDFTTEMDLPILDGILMANSLHYVQNQEKFLHTIQKFLKPAGKLLVVEYNTDEGNAWVPYPVSYPKFLNLTRQAGFINTKILEKIPSAYWGEMYSAHALFSSNLSFD